MATEGFNIKQAGFGSPDRLLSEYAADNKPYIKGQLLWVQDDATGKYGIKRGDWDILNDQPEDTATKFNDLPWFIPPAAEGASGLNLIKVTTSSTANPKYEMVGDDLVITDARLLSVSEVFVYTSASNTTLRPGDYTLDTINGKVTVPNWPGMPDDDEITIILPSILRPEDSVGALAERVAKLERAAAVAMSGQGVFVFKGTEEQIAEMPGFYILTETQGRALFGYKAGDPRFNAIWETTGNKGHYDVAITEDNIPKHNFMTVVDAQISVDGRPDTLGRVLSSIRAKIRKYINTGNPGKEAYDMMGAANTIDSDLDPDIPDVGPTNFYGKDGDEFQNLDVLNPYITVWFLGYTPE